MPHGHAERPVRAARSRWPGKLLHLKPRSAAAGNVTGEYNSKSE